MANYILLMKLTPEGQHAILENPDSIAEAAAEVHVPDVTGLGLYAVLGPYDFVSIIQAPDNEAAARYSVRLGVHIGVSITTLPAVPIALLHERDDPDIDSLITGRAAPIGEPAGPDGSTRA